MPSISTSHHQILNEPLSRKQIEATYIAATHKNSQPQVTLGLENKDGAKPLPEYPRMQLAPVTKLKEKDNAWNEYNATE